MVTFIKRCLLSFTQQMNNIVPVQPFVRFVRENVAGISFVLAIVLVEGFVLSMLPASILQTVLTLAATILNVVIIIKMRLF